MSVNEIMEHKKALEAMKAKKEAAQGAADTYFEQLKEKYECDSIEAAEDLLTTMKANLAADEKKLETAVEEWKKKYENLLELADA